MRQVLWCKGLFAVVPGILLAAAAHAEPTDAPTSPRVWRTHGEPAIIRRDLDFAEDWFPWLVPVGTDSSVRGSGGAAALVNTVSTVVLSPVLRGYWLRLGDTALGTVHSFQPMDTDGYFSLKILEYAEFLCHVGGDLQGTVPLVGSLARGFGGQPLCEEGEAVGYFLHAGQFVDHTRASRTAWRIADGGAFVDLLANGRKPTAWRDRIWVGVGVDADTVGLTQGGWSTLGRGEVFVSSAFGSTYLRGGVDAYWWPSLASLDDQLFDASARVEHVFVVDERRYALHEARSSGPSSEAPGCRS
jgi:hypothetical protein